LEAARAATEADLADLARLCREALAELAAEQRGGPLFVAREARAEPVDESLRHAVLDPGCHVVAGTVDDVVVGLGTGRTERLRNGQLLGLIDEVYVDPEARAVGVGEAIMAELLEWFRACGCLGVDATALPGLRHTKNFFEESGFSARLLVMHHRMEGP
jgi:GNAT superfamily N-acetyltransferase